MVAKVKKAKVEFDLYLAIAQSGPVIRACFTGWDWERDPVSILFTHAYPNSIEWLTEESAVGQLLPRKTMLDSGAFTAWNLGMDFTNVDYMNFVAKQKEIDPSRWSEVVGLDKVGDPEFTYGNCVEMRDEVGVEPMPVFHIGEDFRWLEKYCAEFDKVGLSCRFGESVADSLRFYDDCFAACWPHKFHSFGWTRESMLLSYPFQSADASSFLTSGPRYGNFKTFKAKAKVGGVKIGGRSGYYAVKGEALAALKLERKLRAVWKSEHEKHL